MTTIIFLILRETIQVLSVQFPVVIYFVSVHKLPSIVSEKNQFFGFSPSFSSLLVKLAVSERYSIRT